MPRASAYLFACLVSAVLTQASAPSHARGAPHNDKRSRSMLRDRRQIAFLNSVDDFCLWAPSNPDQDLSATGSAQHTLTAWCVNSAYEIQLIQHGTLSWAHFVKTPGYIQITGAGNLTNINAPADGVASASAEGGRAPGLVFTSAYGQLEQIHDWMSIVSHDQFCFRACRPSAAASCPRIDDIFGCMAHVPGDHATGVFKDSVGDAVDSSSVLHQDVLAPRSGCTTHDTAGKRRIARARRALPSASGSASSASITSTTFSRPPRGTLTPLVSGSTNTATTITPPPFPTPSPNATASANATTSIPYSFNHTQSHSHSHRSTSSSNHSSSSSPSLSSPSSTSSFYSFSNASSPGVSTPYVASSMPPTPTSAFPSSLSSSTTSTLFWSSSSPTSAPSQPFSSPTSTLSQPSSPSSPPASTSSPSSPTSSPAPPPTSSPTPPPTSSPAPPPASTPLPPSPMSSPAPTPTSSPAPSPTSSPASTQSSTVLTFTSPSDSATSAKSPALSNSPTQLSSQCPPPVRAVRNADGTTRPSHLALLCTIWMIVWVLAP